MEVHGPGAEVMKLHLGFVGEVRPEAGARVARAGMAPVSGQSSVTLMVQQWRPACSRPEQSLMGCPTMAA